MAAPVFPRPAGQRRDDCSSPGRPVLGMILKGYPRISESFISNEILLLEEQGIPIRIFSMRHPRESFCHASVSRIRARVDYLPTDLFADFPRLLLAATLQAVSRPARFLAALEKAGERFGRTRSLGTVKHLLQAAYLTRRFLGPRSGVVHLHAHFAHSPTSVALFASMLSGLEFSFTAHAKDIYTSNPGQLREKIDLASLVVTCTRYNVRHLRSLAPQATTAVHSIYHGIDLKLFHNDHPCLRPVEPYRILTVARLTEKKGVPVILEALAILRKQGVSFEHVLIGDGDDRDRILGQVFELDLQDRCLWLGTRSHEEVVREFARADLFVLGCRIAANGDRDGIPNVLVESLAMGLPAVATTVSSLPEIIRDSETGLAVPPQDPEAMARAIHRLLTDQSLRERVIRQGRELVKASFDNRRCVAELAALYRSAIPALASP